jgi:DNA-binding transcriptional regulator YhcF (GntR family)
VDPQQDLTDRLRDRLLNALHVGRIRPGDRLPSIREVARDSGEDHRAVAASYRVLQEEGLVEVRGRSGVYVAQQERVGGELLAETARWLAGVMTDAWRRQIPLTELHDLLRRCTAQARLRVACVESNLDQMTAYCSELAQLFGLDARPVYLSSGGDGPEELAHLQTELARADLVVTTRFHAARVQRAALPAGRPVIVVTVHSQIVEAIQRELERGELVVVSADPEFGERIRAMHARGEEDGARIRVVPAADREAVEGIPPERTVLLTLAARSSLDGARLPSTIPHTPTFSPQTARELSEAIIRLNLRAERLAGGAG